jgi:hypothetical protein
MSKLIAWETPFCLSEWPSVWISAEGDLTKSVIFVRAKELWRIQFESIVGLKVCDETYAKNTRFHIERDKDESCSYIWENSPWFDDFDAEYVEVLGGGKVTHYVLLGGDYNIEILATGKVEIIPTRS